MRCEIGSKVNHAEEAVDQFGAKLLCSQAVMAAFATEPGLERDETALRTAVGFGVGMARTPGLCGGVTGATMVIGLKYGATGPEDHASKELIDGCMISCRGLKSATAPSSAVNCWIAKSTRSRDERWPTAQAFSARSARNWCVRQRGFLTILDEISSDHIQ